MTTLSKYWVIVIRIHRVQITVQKEPKVDDSDSDTVDTNLTSTAAEQESTVAPKEEEESVLDESPSKLYCLFYYCLCIDCCYL